MNEETLFHLALKKPPSERGEFLDRACAGDSALRRRVEVLLRAHATSASLLDVPILPGSEAATMPSEGDPPAGAVPGTKVRYFGDYELLEEIARGGMGIVYKARQLSLNRIVALKLILAGQLASPEDVQRFQREAEAAANLEHPNIVPHEGQHYFSMKLIAGGRLDQADWKHVGATKDEQQQLARLLADYPAVASKPASPRIQQKHMARVMAAVARAVHHAHERGILHRDLKPGNILIDADGQPQVTDFGLAKRLDVTSLTSQPTQSGSGDVAAHAKAVVTQAGVITGTPSYMAPEQARGEKALKTATDVYGLGAVLYELMTGRPPFRAETALDTVLQVLECQPTRPRSLNSRIDAELEAICLKCLEKEAPKRYGSALALAEDLERWLAGQTIQARPSGLVKRTLKWVKRNPALAALVAVLLLWYLDVRLPWRWTWFEGRAWIDWALFGTLGLSGLWGMLWSIVFVCGRRWRNSPKTFDFTRDFRCRGSGTRAARSSGGDLGAVFVPRRHGGSQVTSLGHHSHNLVLGIRSEVALEEKERRSVLFGHSYSRANRHSSRSTNECCDDWHAGGSFRATRQCASKCHLENDTRRGQRLAFLAAGGWY
jgi:serine/threonine protein kinase